MVTFTLHQVTAIVDGPAYRVTNEVTAAQDASPAAFVFKTVNQAYSHYATAADMEQWPDSYDVATLTGKAFYRLPRLVRTWDTVVAMNVDLTATLRRLQLLATDLNARQDSLTVDRTTVVQGV